VKFALPRLLAADHDGSFWMPPARSTMAGAVDQLFYLILWISVFFFLLILGLMIYFVVRYRRGRRSDAPGGPTQHLALELTWTAIPLAIVIVIFAIGLRNVLRLTTPPANAYKIDVVAQKWAWAFTYPNGHVDKDLHVPVDTPILLVMNSPDVIHSFFVPAFRVKQDIIPGRYVKTWFEATEPGEYILYCAEYCGTGHSTMNAQVVVHPANEFDVWLEEAGNLTQKMSPVELGKRIHSVRGCGQCHSLDGSAGQGPTFLGIYGREHLMSDGEKVLVDENYIRESILNPRARIVKGWEAVMPTYQGQLKDDEIFAIIEFIRSLSGTEGAQP
jgi:cytochrome c oxidase subunit 2